MTSYQRVNHFPSCSCRRCAVFLMPFQC
uniref:Uncharacterized protein n=1 Tax=Timema cristinae TaxID=61476 RepID=A0A7R9GUZ3_TIMCR|nr:unnamed protein product [Timema cristinae]